MIKDKVTSAYSSYVCIYDDHRAKQESTTLYRNMLVSCMTAGTNIIKLSAGEYSAQKGMLNTLSKRDRITIQETGKGAIIRLTALPESFEPETGGYNAVLQEELNELWAKYQDLTQYEKTTDEMRLYAFLLKACSRAGSNPFTVTMGEIAMMTDLTQANVARHFYHSHYFRGKTHSQGQFIKTIDVTLSDVGQHQSGHGESDSLIFDLKEKVNALLSDIETKDGQISAMTSEINELRDVKKKFDAIKFAMS